MKNFDKWWTEDGFYLLGDVVAHNEAKVVWKAALGWASSNYCDLWDMPCGEYGTLCDVIPLSIIEEEING